MMEPSIEDITRIQNLVHTSSLGSSKRDVDLVLQTFCEDCVLTNMSAILGQEDVETKGHAAIRALMEPFLPNVEFIHQMMQPAVLEVQEDTARAETLIREYVRMKGQDPILFLGRYDDDFRMTPDGWRFSRRTLHPYGTFPISGPAIA